MSGSGAGYAPPIQDCGDDCGCIACIQRRTIEELIRANREAEATVTAMQADNRRLEREAVRVRVQREECNDRILALEAEAQELRKKLTKVMWREGAPKKRGES